MYDFIFFIYGNSVKTFLKILNNSQKIYFVEFSSQFVYQVIQSIFKFKNEANCFLTPVLISTNPLLKWTASNPCKCPASESPTRCQTGSSRESWRRPYHQTLTADLEWRQKLLRSPFAEWASPLSCWNTNVLRFCRGTSSNHGNKFDTKNHQQLISCHGLILV